MKVVQRPVKVRLQADLDTIKSLKQKLASKLAENPDINELVKAQDLAYSRLDSLYKGNQIAHSAEIVNLTQQLEEKGNQVMIERVKTDVWRETAQASEKDYNKERRKKGFWRTSAAIITGVALYLAVK